MLVDISFSLPACKFGRACYCHSFREDGANYGRCPSKKETYFGSRSMPWSPWRAISRHLRWPRPRWTTGKGSGILQRTALAWWSWRTRNMPEKSFEMTCAGRGYAWCHWSLQAIRRTGQRKYGASSFVSGGGWRPYSHNLAGSWMRKKYLRKAFGDYVPGCKTKCWDLICAWHSAAYSAPPVILAKSRSWYFENLNIQKLEGTFCAF